MQTLKKRTLASIVVSLPLIVDCRLQSPLNTKGKRITIMPMNLLLLILLASSLFTREQYSTEWIRSDARRTAVGLDLDLEALLWCLRNNLTTISGGAYSRLSLFHGNVLHPVKAKLVKQNDDDGMESHLHGSTGCHENLVSAGDSSHLKELCLIDIASLPERDIICAFNYSCCCLHVRSELVVYFKHARTYLSKRGGIFIMDLYGGSSSEDELKLKRKFSNFTYIWQQDKFDIINHMTKVSLHFQVGRGHMLRQAFTYTWRLWSLPEVRDCMLEAGFHSVHFWIRKLPDTRQSSSTEDYEDDPDAKYEESSYFEQCDGWSAYIIAVN